MKEQWIILKKGYNTAEFIFFEGTLEQAIYEARSECKGMYHTNTVLPFKPVYQAREDVLESTTNFVKV